MKKFLLASVAASVFAVPAIAADAIVYADPAPAQPVAERFAYDWNGLYIGGIGGLGTGDFDYAGGFVGGPEDISGSVSAGGAFGGVQVGYDWQVGSWVFGAVADIAKTNIEADASLTDGTDTLSASSELDYLGTVRGRVGYAFDRALVYAHGGYAYGRTEQNINLSGADFFDGRTRRDGYAVGGGIEYAVTDMISIGTEYSYVDLGTKDVFVGDLGFGGDDVFINEDVKFHQIKAAVNFRF